MGPLPVGPLPVGPLPVSFPETHVIRCAFCTDIISHQQYRNTVTSPSQQSLLMVPTLPLAKGLSSVSSALKPSGSLPPRPSPHHRVRTAPIKTIDDSCATEATGQARALRPLEGTEGALHGGSPSLPLEDPSRLQRFKGPLLLLHLGNCPAPFCSLLRPSSCTHSASRLLSVREH